MNFNALSAPSASPAPPGAATDWTVPQEWSAYTAAEHATWNLLFDRQMAVLAERVTPAFLRGVDALQLSRQGVPDFSELSERLHALTGWTVVAVPGIVPDAVFFEHLSQRRFVAGRFIRRPDQIDYLQEPDVFHDVFGHVPLLADPVFADYMQAYGLGGLRSLRFGALPKLARLYWYTVEFGLIREAGALHLYGAGIVSSYGESVFALDDASPHRIGFDLRRVMRTPYRIDAYQGNYFVIDSFEDLLRQTLDADFAPLYAELEDQPDFEIDTIVAGDRVIHRGTQAHTRVRVP